MKFSSKEDLDIPKDKTFEILSDFKAFERKAMRHGAAIVRTAPQSRGPIGTSWAIQATIRGKSRNIQLSLTDYEPATFLSFSAVSSEFSAVMSFELTEHSDAKTRMRAALEIKAKTLSARLMMQSARLAKKTLNNRYKLRVANFAEDLEQKYAV